MTPTLCVVASYAVGLSMDVDRFPQPGETRIGSGFVQGPGGKGSNQAIQAARLGAEVELVACVGDDPYGRDAFDLWRREGISTEYVVQVGDYPTGVGFILVDEVGQNSIAIDPGANNALGTSVVDCARPAFERSAVCLVQLEIPLDSAAYALKIAKEAGCITVLDPAPARPIPDEAWAYVDVVTPNEGEATIILGTEGTVEEIGEKLLEKVNMAAIVTLGEKGVFYLDKAGIAEWVPAFPVRVRDTTGAGDAFAGALGVKLAQGGDQLEAVRWGAAAGALACTVPGVVPALPTQEALLEILARDGSAQHQEMAHESEE
ncbi:MAG: ribokinase [Rubrobacteraceae bacterium]|nr:ribokinase [Rubrobacteraceae bacterium]